MYTVFKTRTIVSGDEPIPNPDWSTTCHSVDNNNDVDRKPRCQHSAQISEDHTHAHNLTTNYSSYFCCHSPLVDVIQNIFLGVNRFGE